MTIPVPTDWVGNSQWYNHSWLKFHSLARRSRVTTRPSIPLSQSASFKHFYECFSSSKLYDLESWGQILKERVIFSLSRFIEKPASPRPPSVSRAGPPIHPPARIPLRLSPHAQWGFFWVRAHPAILGPIYSALHSYMIRIPRYIHRGTAIHPS